MSSLTSDNTQKNQLDYIRFRCFFKRMRATKTTEKGSSPAWVWKTFFVFHIDTPSTYRMCGCVSRDIDMHTEPSRARETAQQLSFPSRLTGWSRLSVNASSLPDSCFRVFVICLLKIQVLRWNSSNNCSANRICAQSVGRWMNGVRERKKNNQLVYGTLKIDYNNSVKHRICCYLIYIPVHHKAVLR